MASEQQLAANQANAQKSTGPRTDDGKAASRLNAVTHGLSAQTAVMPGESQSEFDQFTQRIIDNIGPFGVIEGRFAEQLASVLWRLARVQRFESAVFESTMRRQKLDGGLGDKIHVLIPRSSLVAVEAPTGSTAGQPTTTAYILPPLTIEEAESRLTLGQMLREMLCSDVIAKLDRHEANLMRQAQRILDQLEKLSQARATRKRCDHPGNEAALITSSSSPYTT